MLHEKLRSYLTTHAVVGQLIAQRMYPIEAPAKAPRPFVVYQLVSGTRHYDHDGYSHGTPRYQLTCVADTYDEAKALAQAVIEAMESWPEHSATLDGEVEDYIDTVNRYEIPLDFIIWV